MPGTLRKSPITPNPARGSDTSLRDRALSQLLRLCSDLELPHIQVSGMLRAFDLLLSPWGHAHLPERPSWPSDITDDHTPFECSVALSPGRVDLRLLVEAQAEVMSGAAAWDAGIQINNRIASQSSVSLQGFESIRGLFAPDPRFPPRFSLWHSAVIDALGHVAFKVYLNPQVLGPAGAPGIVQDALRTLGLDHAWDSLGPLLVARPDRNQLLYLSLDLNATSRARVKVYVAHGEATAEDLEDQLSLFATYTKGRATRLLQALMKENGPFLRRPILTCLNYVAEEQPQVTIHLPLRSYVPNDEESLERICGLLPQDQASRLRRGVAAYSNRPLSEASGVISYASESILDLARRLVVYLAPETYSSHRVGILDPDLQRVAS